MDRIKPDAARLGALIVLVSLGALGSAAVGGAPAFAAGADVGTGTGTGGSTGGSATLGRAGAVRNARANVQVLGVADYLLSVGNLDRSVAFYRNVIGLPLLRAPGRAVADPLEQSLTDTPGARFRSAAFANPAVGPALVIEEFTGINRRTLRPRAVDPGAATVQIAVRDLAPVLAAAARAGIPIVTRGGRALPMDRYGTQAIVLRDPDGFYVRLSQPSAVAARSASALAPDTATAGFGTGNVLGLRVQYTVAATAAIVRFYHGVLGLRVRAGAFTRDGSVSALFDVPGAQRALTETAPVDNGATSGSGGATAGSGGATASPGSTAVSSSSAAVDTADAGAVLQFAAFRGVSRRTYGGRPQDTGTPAVALRVKDLTSALRAVRASGTIIVSAGGQPVPTGRGGATVLVRDSAGLLVQLIQDPDRSLR